MTASGCELSGEYEGKISFGSELQLDNVKLWVRVGEHSTNVVIEGVMKVRDPDITFAGMLFLIIKRLTLMDTCCTD